jgi:hypothetical protein
MGYLPHYKNSVAGMQQYEPVYLNLYEVSIVPPPALQGTWDKPLIIEGVRKINGLKVEQHPGNVTQYFKGHQRSYAGSFVTSTYVDINMDFEVNVNNENSMYTYKALRNWTDLVRNPLTGAMATKQTYASTSVMTIHLYKKPGEILRTWIFTPIYPSSALNEMNLDYTNGSIFTASIQFRSDSWEDVTI